MSGLQQETGIHGGMLFVKLPAAREFRSMKVLMT